MKSYVQDILFIPLHEKADDTQAGSLLNISLPDGSRIFVLAPSTFGESPSCVLGVSLTALDESKYIC